MIYIKIKIETKYIIYNDINKNRGIKLNFVHKHSAPLFLCILRQKTIATMMMMMMMILPLLPRSIHVASASAAARLTAKKRRIRRRHRA